MERDDFNEKMDLRNKLKKASKGLSFKLSFMERCISFNVFSFFPSKTTIRKHEIKANIYKHL